MRYPVTIRYWAGARAAAGVESETFQAETVSDSLAEARRRHGSDFARVLPVCSILLDGVRQGMQDLVAPLEGPVDIEVLPPFAGG